MLMRKTSGLRHNNVLVGLLENSELCQMDNLLEQSQNENFWLIISTSILDKEV